LPGVRCFAGRLGMLGGSVARRAVITGQFLHSEDDREQRRGGEGGRNGGDPQSFPLWDARAP
jgi:hypothetical protein